MDVPLVVMPVVALQPDGRCREQEGCCDPRPVPPAQGLQEDPRQARQGAGEEIQWQGEFLMFCCSTVVLSLCGNVELLTMLE